MLFCSVIEKNRSSSSNIRRVLSAAPLIAIEHSENYSNFHEDFHVHEDLGCLSHVKKLYSYGFLTVLNIWKDYKYEKTEKYCNFHTAALKYSQ